MPTTAERVTQIIAEQLGTSASELKPSTRLIADLGADSLDTIELVMSIEETYEMEISDDDAEKCLTIADCIALVERLIGSKAQA